MARGMGSWRVFFFRQETAYEVGTGDWSSDVCSSDLANLVSWKDKPVALSIVQARVVGLAHFTAGYIITYAAFLIASTSSRFG